MARTYDAIILERRYIVGDACVTEETSAVSKYRIAFMAPSMPGTASDTLADALSYTTDEPLLTRGELAHRIQVVYMLPNE